MKKFDNEKYQILAKDLMGDIFYSETSNRNKIATIRQYAEVIVRKILDINPSKKNDDWRKMKYLKKLMLSIIVSF